MNGGNESQGGLSLGHSGGTRGKTSADLEQDKRAWPQMVTRKELFFQKFVRYLGHVVSEEGMKTDPDKIAALTTWPRPKNSLELKSFLGFTDYYHRFIKDYSKISRPLNGYAPVRKPKHHKSLSESVLK